MSEKRTLSDADVDAIADAVTARLRVLVARGARGGKVLKPQKRTAPVPSKPNVEISQVDRARALAILRRNGVVR